MLVIQFVSIAGKSSIRSRFYSPVQLWAHILYFGVFFFFFPHIKIQHDCRKGTYDERWIKRTNKKSLFITVSGTSISNRTCFVYVLNQFIVTSLRLARMFLPLIWIGFSDSLSLLLLRLPTCDFIDTSSEVTLFAVFSAFAISYHHTTAAASDTWSRRFRLETRTSSQT